MYKRLLPEDTMLRERKVTSGAKIMVVGAMINDVLAAYTPKDALQRDAKAGENKKELLCRQTQHRRVLDKGKLEDVTSSVKVSRSACQGLLCRAYTVSLEKRDSFLSLEQDQLWIGATGGLTSYPWAPVKMWPLNLWKDTKNNHGPHGSLLLLGVLGSNSVCGCNPRHCAGQMAVF